MLKPDFPLRTARLTLRAFTHDDLDGLYAIHRSPEVARYLTWEPRDREQTRSVLEERIACNALLDENRVLAIAVERNDTGQLIGDCMIRWLSREHSRGEIGFVFHPEHHGKGFATEAARELLRLSFEELGLHRVIGRCDARNAGSAGVMRRLGMRCEAHLVESEFIKGEWADELIFAMLRREWESIPR